MRLIIQDQQSITPIYLHEVDLQRTVVRAAISLHPCGKSTVSVGELREWTVVNGGAEAGRYALAFA